MRLGGTFYHCNEVENKVAPNNQPSRWDWYRDDWNCQLRRRACLYKTLWNQSETSSLSCVRGEALLPLGRNMPGLQKKSSLMSSSSLSSEESAPEALQDQSLPQAGLHNKQSKLEAAPTQRVHVTIGAVPAGPQKNSRDSIPWDPWTCREF